MPATMVHLAVAHALAMKAQADGSGEYYLGSLAPDAVHLRPGMVKEDKRRSHLCGPREDGAKPRIEEEHVRQFLFRHWAEGTGAAFAEGYAVHVLTDSLWYREVLLAYRQRVREDGRWDEMPGLYYRDCDAVDEELYFCCPWRPQVWALLGRAQPKEFDGLMSAEEIAGWRGRTMGRLEADPSPADRWPLYMETPDVIAFAKKAAFGIGRTMDSWRGSHRASSPKEATA